MIPHLASRVQLAVRSKMWFSAARRTPCAQAAARHKFLILLAVVFLFAWMQLGSLRSTHSGQNGQGRFAEVIERAKARRATQNKEETSSEQRVIMPKGKAKEYLDFDYKYDLKRKPEPAASTAIKPKSSSAILANSKSSKEAALRRRPLYPPSDDANELPVRDYQRPKGAAADGHNRGVANVTSVKLPIAEPPRVYRRRQNSLNGVRLSDHHEQFDVVGSLDLYHGHPQDEDEFAADDALVVDGAGDGGEPVQLDEEETLRGEAVMKKEAFNLVASDKMSLHRVVPDTRDPKCSAVTYDDVDTLPTASVVIIFTNEAWTPLLRTIWSVLDKTPPQLLHEIILIDDFSDKKHLKGKLERYISRRLPSKVRLKRLHRRSGLIRARLTGAELATGDTLVFLDSHCECGYDWLQPLLQRIKEEPRAFVVPIIDVIDDRTMEYYHGNGAYFQIGGFTWNGHFNWIDIPEHENVRRGSPVAPTRTPTMAGGLFAVDRDYFWRSGSYDEEMDVWGGENLEMSFRVWQCGGILETIPCSRVGHIFRSFHPYTFPGNKDTHGINTARTVEVWMDDYKRLFYMNRPDLLSVDIGDVSKRLKFKQELGCRSFQWYLQNVFPQKFVLDDADHVFAYGRGRNPASNLCMDTMQNDEKDRYRLGVYPCHDTVSATQFFSFSKKYELRREETCAEVDSLADTSPRSPLEVTMASCHGNGGSQEWTHTKEGRLVHKATGRCLATAGEQLVAAPCKASDNQVWFFDNYFS